LGPVPRNFLVANVTRKSPTSYGLVTRKLATSPTSPRGSYDEVKDVTRKLRRAGPCEIWPILAARVMWSVQAGGRVHRLSKVAAPAAASHHRLLRVSIPRQDVQRTQYPRRTQRVPQGGP